MEVMKIQFISSAPMVRETPQIEGPAEAVCNIMPLLNELASDIGGMDQEIAIAIPLNTRHEAGTPILISVGAMDQAVIDMRVLFRRLLTVGASAFIFIHNHPSGSDEFSQADIDLTKRVKEAGRIVNIDLIDHIVIYGENNFTSYIEAFGSL
jgi:DNA repair protein RadC